MRPGRPYRVLLVDDNDLLVETLTELLGQDGRFEIAGRARNGLEALDLAESCTPDVVLMDIAMPVMDGIEATRELTARHPTTPVVIVSGSEYQDGALEARYAGAIDYVRKGRLTRDLVIATIGALEHVQALNKEQTRSV